MKITVEFKCPRGCHEQRIDFDSLDDLLCNLSESGWPICQECGSDTTHEIISKDVTSEYINVEELMFELGKVEDKRQVVVGCIRGVEICESLIVGVKSEKPDDDTVGVCWLKFRDDSSIHQT